MDTKQIVFTAPGKAELLNVEYLPPKADEVTVELEYSAISAGTEKANFLGIRNSTYLAEDAEVKFPITVGYTAAGHVIAVGENVKKLQVGDRVGVYWGKHKKCITIAEKQVYKLPEGVSTKEASMALIATFP